MDYYTSQEFKQQLADMVKAGLDAVYNEHDTFLDMGQCLTKEGK